MSDEPEFTFPFIGMAIGDSFFIPTAQPEFMRNLILKEASKFSTGFVAAIKVEGDIIGVRCWREE